VTAHKRFSNVIGFDDAPFTPEQVGPVPVVGAVFTRLQLTGVIIGAVEKDGSDAAEGLTRLLAGSKFAEHVQLVMLQGIALAGFNVVDIFYLHEQLGLPVLVVARKAPDMAAIQKALLTQVQGGREKWALIEKLGPMEPAGSVYVQRAGLTLEEAQAVISQFAIHSHVPEPLRTAHLIAGALVDGQSRGRA
jgi:endonuclease V-like protein UPF0215 family